MTAELTPEVLLRLESAQQVRSTVGFDCMEDRISFEAALLNYAPALLAAARERDRLDKDNFDLAATCVAKAQNEAKLAQRIAELEAKLEEQTRAREHHRQWADMVEEANKRCTQELAEKVRRIAELEGALRIFAECDMNEGNCASVELASKRVRNMAREALAGKEEK